MQYFIYIGRDSKTIELFSKLNVGVFYAVPNCSKAIKAVDKIREKYDIALFFEQVDLSKDIADIRDFTWYLLWIRCLKKKRHNI